MPILAVFFSVLGLTLLIIGGRYRSIQAEMRSIKRMLVRELRPGILAEISGTAQLEPPLITPFSNKTCVYYEYEVERLEERHGKTEWEPIWQKKTDNRFYVYDGTGTVSITPKDASIDIPIISEGPLQAGDIYSQKDLRELVNLISGYEARVREKAILIGSSTYVFGSVFSSDDKLYMMKGRRPLYISTKSEEMVEQEIGRKGALFSIAGLVGLFGGVTLIFLIYFVL